MAVLIQATDDGTTFQVDLDGNGTWDSLDTNGDSVVDSSTVSLSRGQTFLLNDASAGRTAGATGITMNSVIQGNKTLQVKIIIGDPAANYETRGLSAFPRGYWTKDYYASVGQPATGRNTDVFLYNPHATSLTVNYQTGAGSGTFTISPKDTVSFRRILGGTVPAGGAYFSGSDVFWGVSTIDSENQAYEWAYSLLPTTLLYAEHFLGWAPDTLPNPGAAADRDNNGVFLTVAQDNTTVFVDLNNDGTVDQTYTLSRLQSQYIYDPNDGDLSGAHFWATGPFTMAFGENPDTAQASTASLDLGYVAIPATDFISLVLTVDKTVSPQVVSTAAGSVATFTVKVNSQKYTVDGVTVTDYLPPGWAYIVGTDTTTITRPDKTVITGTAADPAGVGSLTTLAWSSTQLGGNMGLNQEITITFTARTTAVLPSGTLSRNRVEAVGTRTLGSPSVTQTFSAADFAFVTSGNVSISKTSSVPVTTPPTPLYPGDTVTYTTQVTNPSGPTITGVALYDPLPVGTSYVAASGSVTCELPRNVRDEFTTAAYTNNNGSASWASNWTETDAYGGGATGATGGFAWITGGQLQLRYLLATVGDQFASAAYNLNTGSNNWADDWTEEGGLDGVATNAANQEIYITGARLRLDRANSSAFAIRRTASVGNGSSVTISFVPYDVGIGAGEQVVAEYFADGVGPTPLATFDGSGNPAAWNGATQTYTIASFPGASITLRFRATGAWSANTDHMEVDNVQISYSPAGTQIQRIANLTGAVTPSLSFSSAAAGLVAGDTAVLEAKSAAAGTFTTLATFAGGTPSVAPPYDLTPYISAATTIRFRVTGGYNAAGKTLSFDNVDISYGVVGAFASGNPPEFLSASTGCRIRSGGTPVTLTFNATVDNPLASGLTSITNTASTTSTQFPIAISASVTDIVANPSVLSASVAGRVWFDGDGDAAQDIGEPGIANVEVTLKDRFGTPVATTIADANGRYLFAGVAAGTGYYVEVTDFLPSGLTQTAPTGHTDNRTNAFDLAAGQDYTGADLGYRSAPTFATFGDLVWVDANANGVRDAGEVGLGGVTVQRWLDVNGNDILEPVTDTLQASTTTAPDGSYLFTGVPAAGTEDYIIAVVSPSGYTATTNASRTYPNVPGGSVLLTADFGFRANAGSLTIRDRVWLDTNGDGAFGSESGIAGVTVELLNASLQVIGTTVTAADGTFFFSGVAGGGADYTIRLNDTGGLLIDFVGTTSYALARQRAESNLNASIDRVTAPPPSYGFRPSRAIGDTIFRDVNGNGIQEAGDGGFAGVSVSLYRDTNSNNLLDLGTDQLVGTVTTDANGQYLFTGLANGTYIVSVPTAPTNYTFSGPGTDTDPAAGIQKTATMAGSNILDRDFGYEPTGTPRTLGGTIWADLDADGVIGASEAKLAGVTLDVLDGGGALVATVTTDASGAYSVAGLASGTYSVRVTDTSGALAGYAPTYEKTGGTAGPFDYVESVNLSAGDVTDVNFGYGRLQLTYAAVAWLRAYRSGGPVVVEWKTTYEAGTAGFHLFRLDLAANGWTRLDEKLLPGLIVHPEGGTYRFVDSSAPGDDGLVYRLVEVDVRGAEREYGPYSVRVAAEAPPSTSDAPREAGRGGFDRRPAAASPARIALARASWAARHAWRRTAPGRSDRAAVLKVTTTEAGLHYLAAARLASFSGLAPETVSQLIQRNMLKLTSRGRVVPWFPAAGGAGVYFLARKESGVYTAESALRVTFDSSRPMATAISVPAGILSTSFPETAHAEEDQFPVLAYSQDLKSDFWFWEFLFAGDDTLDTKTLTVRAPAVAGTGAARLVVHLMGGSEIGVAGEHHVTVSLNGNVLGSVTWDGITRRDAEFALGAGDVVDGDNTVTVKAVLDPGVTENIVYLDSVDLEYERLYRAEADELAFTAPGFAAVDVAGFSSADVVLLDVTDPARPTRVVGGSVLPAGDGTYTLHFGVSRPEGGRYLAVASNRAKTLVRVTPWHDAGLLDASNRADYVIVAPDSLASAAQSLADYRTGRGVETKVIPLEAIYDTFNDGFAEPGAIRSFLRYATSRWSGPPRYATLAGRGTWDYRNRLGWGDNLVPPLLVGTANGLVASDVGLGDLAGDDGVPEVAIGRLPALTPQELLDYVAKAELQEGAPAAPWQQRVLMVADNPDRAGNFTADSEDVATLVPPANVVDRVYLSLSSPAAARQAILDTVNGGALIFNYIGHGNVDRLADENILTNPDVRLLTNADRLPVFLAMTCSVGNFANPGYPSLGELLLLKKDGGAYAVWAPSWLSQNDLAVRLDKAFFRSVFVDGETVVGDAVGRGLASLTVPGSREHRLMYNLLGEPVARLPLAPASRVMSAP